MQRRTDLNLILFCLLPCTWEPAFSQSFTQTIGGMNAQDGLGAWPAGNGYCVVVREAVDQAQPYRAAIYSMNNSGGSVSSSPLDSANLFLQDVVNTPAGDVFAVGSILRDRPEHHDAVVIKLSSTGEVIWTLASPSPGAQQLLGGMALPDGGLVACGLSTSNGGHDVLVERYSTTGGVLWSYTGSGTHDAEGLAVAISGNDIMVTGRQTTPSGQEDVLLMRMDLQGGVLWSTSLGGPGSDVGQAIVANGNSTFTVAGWTDSFGTFDHTSQRIPDHGYLLNVDLNGDTLWTRTLGDSLYDHRLYGMRPASNGDLFLTGERATAGLSDAVLLRTQPDGLVLWQRALDLGKEERLTHVLPLANGVVATGWSFGPFGRQLFFVRRNDQGN